MKLLKICRPYPPFVQKSTPMSHILLILVIFHGHVILKICAPGNLDSTTQRL